MDANIKVALDIANQIRDDNLRGKDKVPTSENFIKKMVQTHDKGPDDINLFLQRLEESHYIFIFNVVNADPSLFVQEVKAFIYADPAVISELKHHVENKLSQIYESTFYKKKSGMHVLREFGSKLKEYNNTTLGRALNELMMIEEYSRLIAANAFNYTDSWRKEKLFKLFREDDGSDKDFEIEIEPTLSKESIPLVTASRAEPLVPQNKPQPSGKWMKAVNNFSVKFLLRIHFRKYEFDVVRKLIITGKITEIEDFYFIRDYLKEMETMKDKDPILKYHIGRMVELRRLAQAKINIIRKSKTSESSQVA